MAMADGIAYSHGLVSISCSAMMAMPYSNHVNNKIRCSSSDIEKERRNQPQKRCLRCNTFYVDAHNSPAACSFHGHTTGEKGLFALAPPHQGIDGEWSDLSGVIVYRWNEKSNRPNTGRANWKRRWSCCAEYDENAPLVDEDGMFSTMMASFCTSQTPIQSCCCFATLYIEAMAVIRYQNVWHPVRNI